MIDNPIGKITTTLEITNRLDQVLAARGFIPPEQVRTITLHDVSINTRTTLLCLNQDIIAQLGLEFLREVDVSTTTSIGKARIFRDAKISLLGREGTFECLELPGGNNALLGRIPLEALGIELDLQNQRLRLLPISPTDTYLTIL